MRRLAITDDRGAAAVEFALVLPILMALLFGIIEFGSMYNAQLMVTAAAREGARSMAIDADATTAKSAAVAAGSSISLTTAEVAVSSTTCTAGNTVTVSVTHRKPFITGLFGTSITLRGTATRQCGG